MIANIPTMYDGVQFRSRLEARWAAFFNLVGWKWQYEPFDLVGWIPDFALIGTTATILVEVKPVLEFEQSIHDKVNTGTRDMEHDTNGNVGKVILLGHNLRTVFSIYEDGKPLVSLGQFVNGDDVIFCTDTMETHVDFASELYSWDGHLFGKCRIVKEENTRYVTEYEAQKVWREAGNRVQWKSPAYKAG